MDGRRSWLAAQPTAVLLAHAEECNIAAPFLLDSGELIERIIESEVRAPTREEPPRRNAVDRNVAAAVAAEPDVPPWRRGGRLPARPSPYGAVPRLRRGPGFVRLMRDLCCGYPGRLLAPAAGADADVPAAAPAVLPRPRALLAAGSPVADQDAEPISRSSTSMDASTIVVRFSSHASGGNEGDGDIDAERRCSICLELFEAGQELRVLPCLHKFHAECIDPWLTRRSLCPVCKHNLHQS